MPFLAVFSALRSLGSSTGVADAINHALHMAVICQLRHPGSDGRVYFDRRLAEGRTKKEALRSLKRHVSNAVYRQLTADAARARG
jgi:transposase